MSVDELVIAVRVELADTQQKLSKVEEGIKKLSDNGGKNSARLQESFVDLGKVAEAALGFGIADLSVKAAQAMREFAVDGVRSSIAFTDQMSILERQTQGTARVLITDLRAATRGMVDDLTLAQSANRALSFGLQQEAIPALAATATALGKIQGLNTADAFRDIVTGIARASPQILDNLGIILDADKAYSDYAESIGKSTEALSKHERTLAVQNAVAENSQFIVLQNVMAADSLGDAWQRVGATFKNIKKDVGDSIMFLFDGTGTIGKSNSITNGLTYFQSSLGDTRKKIGELAIEMTNLKSKYDDATFSITSTTEALKGLMNQGTEKQDAASVRLIELRQEEIALQRQLATGGVDTAKIQNELAKIRTERESENLKIEEDRLAMQKVNLLNKKDIQEAITGQEYKSIQNASEYETLLKNQLTKITDARAEHTKIYEQMQGVNQQSFEVATNFITMAQNMKLTSEDASKLKEIMAGMPASAGGSGGGSSGTSSGNKSHAGEAIAGGAGMVKFGGNVIVATKKKKNDFVMRPGQAAEEFSADDTLIGVKDPAALFGGKGGGGINITIGAIYGVNAAEISRELRYRLQDVIPVN